MKIDNPKVSGELTLIGGGSSTLSGSFSGSFQGDGSDITNIQSSSFSTTSSFALNVGSSLVFTTTVSGSSGSTDWSGSDPYVATKTVNGILSTDIPIVDIDLSGETFANVFVVEDDWALVYRVEASADDEIKLYASQEPIEDFDLIIQVNR